MGVRTKRVMYFHADACPVGGYLTKPFATVVPNDASVSLGQAGGHANARTDQVKLDETISAGPVYSQVTGSVQSASGNWTTLVTSVAENVNIHEVVTADRIVSQMAIEHPRVGHYPSISFAGSQFQNLRINGSPVTVAVDLHLLSSHEQVSGKDAEAETAAPAPGLVEFPDVPWPDVPGFVNRAVAQSQAIEDNPSTPDWLKERYAWVASKGERNQKGYVLCSLATALAGTPPQSTFGHIVTVPGFGTIFLGELIVDAQSFHLTMLRVELGGVTRGRDGLSAAPVAAMSAAMAADDGGDGDGDVSFGTTHGNGRPVP